MNSVGATFSFERLKIPKPGPNAGGQMAMAVPRPILFLLGYFSGFF